MPTCGAGWVGNGAALSRLFTSWDLLLSRSSASANGSLSSPSCTHRRPQTQTLLHSKPPQFAMKPQQSATQTWYGTCKRRPETCYVVQAHVNLTKSQLASMRNSSHAVLITAQTQVRGSRARAPQRAGQDGPVWHRPGAHAGRRGARPRA